MEEPEEQTEKGGAANESGESVVSDSLRALCEELVQAQARARELGLFVGDRPLLECPACRLMEDVTIEGFLVVYPAEQLEQLNREGTSGLARAQDTGLRFADLSESQFLCPACGRVFTAPEEDLFDDGDGATGHGL